MFQAWISLLNNKLYVSQPHTANKHHHKLLEIDSHTISAKIQSLRHFNTSITPPRRTKQKTSIAKQEYPPLPRSQHPNFYLLYYTNFYTIIIFNSPTIVIILNGNFIDGHKILLTNTKIIVYCIVCLIIRKCST
jgi:hypothetical protein